MSKLHNKDLDDMLDDVDESMSEYDTEERKLETNTYNETLTSLLLVYQKKKY